MVRRGSEGLVIALHGYGSDEHQFETLAPLDVPVVTVTPRAPVVVDPGFGWWVPVERSDGQVELAPVEQVSTAVDLVASLVSSLQHTHGFGPRSTVLLGYSQGASLALLVGATHPGLIAGVAAVAGFLVPDEHVSADEQPLDVFLANGTLDPLVTEAHHASTVARFREAGHRVTERRDRVPHVLDESQVPLIDEFVRQSIDPNAT